VDEIWDLTAQITSTGLIVGELRTVLMVFKPLIMVILIFFVGINSVSASTIYVADDYSTIYVPDDYSTIQEAVNNAAFGDTVIVRDGIYQEHVYIEKRFLTVKSENGPTNCVVRGGPYVRGAGYVFKLSNLGIKLSGFTITGGGIMVASNNNSILNNNVISNGEYGICFFSSANNTVMNNNVSKNSYGIYLYSYYHNIIACGNNIIGNNISDNYDGVLADSSCNNTISNNNVWNNYNGIFMDCSSDNTVVNNNFTSNGYYPVTSPNGYGICFYSSSNNTIYFNNFINNAEDVYSSESTNIWSSTSKIAYTYQGRNYENCIGNYWDDYNGTDDNSDGIGDTPHIIDSDTDLYPLINPQVQIGHLEIFPLCLIVGAAVAIASAALAIGIFRTRRKQTAPSK